MWDRQQPLHQRQPAVQVAFDVRVVDLEVDLLLLDRRRVLVGQQHEVGTDAGAEPGQLAGEVEPPAWVALPEQDHQQRGHEQATGDPTTRGADGLATLLIDRPGHAGGEDAVDDRDRDDQHHPERRLHPVVLGRVVDVEAGRVGGWCGRCALVGHADLLVSPSFRSRLPGPSGLGERPTSSGTCGLARRRSGARRSRCRGRPESQASVPVSGSGSWTWACGRDCQRAQSLLTSLAARWRAGR